VVGLDNFATGYQRNQDYVLHQAVRDAGVKSFTYAASSFTYGDYPALPKV
jgi:hypothetical protein